MNQIVKNRFRIALAVLILSQGQAIAQEALSIDTDSNTYVRTADGPFDDIAFAVEQAIINEGLVIDLTSHVGDMLARTKEDVSGLCCTNRVRDSFRESSVVAVQYEQTHTPRLQDQELARL